MLTYEGKYKQLEFFHCTIVKDLLQQLFQIDVVINGDNSRTKNRPIVTYVSRPSATGGLANFFTKSCL